MIGRSQGHLAVTACVLGLGAGAAPDATTDLRPAGPPEVLAVLMSDDASGDGIVETATFCKANDTKRPGLVPADPAGPTQICPEDLAMGVDEVTDTVPVGWYVRFQFDELLNPNIEDLLPIVDAQGNDSGTFSGSLANTQPVTITCGGVNVPYDGFYNPSGNSFTWEVGPSLFITPNDTSTIAAGTECQVTLKADVVADKDGNHVPADQLGPYKFKIAPLTLASTTPAPPKDLAKPTTISPTQAVTVTFNATIDVASLAVAEVVITKGVASCSDTTGGTAVIAAISATPKDPTSIDLSDAAATAATAANSWAPSTTYIVTFVDGADVKDLAGASLAITGADNPSICFKTGT
jgi:hypothetical protein